MHSDEIIEWKMMTFKCFFTFVIKKRYNETDDNFFSIIYKSKVFEKKNALKQAILQEKKIFV